MISHRSGKAPKKRAKFLYLLIVGFFVVALRLVDVQLLKHDKYERLSLNQSQTKVTIPAKRGRILDRHGQVLAESFYAPNLVADPVIFNLKEKDHPSLKRIANVCGLSFEELCERLQRKKRRYVVLAKQLDLDQVEEISVIVRGLPGINFEKNWGRFYALGEMLSPVIGVVGAKHTGLEGLEARYNHVLKGTEGKLLHTRDGKRGILKEERLSEPQVGKDLKLSIDSVIQTFLFKELNRGFLKYEPISASGVVIDPHSGEILAMATLPSHRPGQRISRDLKGLRPKMCLDVYEPGSTIKPFIYAAMLEDKLCKPTDTLHCGYGKKRFFGNRTVHDVGRYGEISMETVIIKSSNIGVAQMGIKLGKQRVHQILDQLGFGHRNHLPFPGEPRGLLRPVSKWDNYSIVSIPYGHEMSVTLVQLARAYAAVANGGTVIQPCLEKAILTQNGTTDREGTGLPMAKVFSKNTCELTLKALGGVVNLGTGRKARSSIYQVGGKSGTTEKIVNGKYSPDHNSSSFVAVAPLSDPKLVVAVMLDEPQAPRGKRGGGSVAAPIVRHVLEDSLQFMSIPSDIN
jgi:cell division protein FtsI (penicillin-binding protein 3)